MLFEILHVDISIIRFFSKSAVNPRYFLLAVDLFTSKIYTDPMKSKNLLKKKLAKFYNDIPKKRDKYKVMCLQVDQEFQ